MFATHGPIIQRWAQAHPSNLAKVQLMAILSARQPFYKVREQFRAVLAGDAKPLFSWKRKAWEEAKANADARYLNLMQLRDAPEAQLFEVARWYGLGLVKGGFVLQCAFGVAGCIDSRYVDRYGLPMDQYATSKFRTFDKLCAGVDAYLTHVEQLGGTAKLWDEWCNTYTAPGSHLTPGWDVSAEHCRILGLQRSASLPQQA